MVRLLVSAALALVVSAKHPEVPAAHTAHVRTLANLTGPISCPCSDASLCRPHYVPLGTFARDKEVFGFVGDGGVHYAGYDWTVVSSVAWATSSDLMCEAHKHGARVIMSAPAIPAGFPADDNARKTWIDAAVNAAKRGHYDGLTFDYESPITGAGAATFLLHMT